MKIIEKLKDYLPLFIFILVVAFIFSIGRLLDRDGSTWHGKGMINLYPYNAKAKNYRLKADMYIYTKPDGLFGTKTQYDIEKVYWPNGGYTEFEHCTVIPEDSINECFEENGKDWMVEIHNIIKDSGDYINEPVE
jgi:hypothetical protein